MSPGKFWKQERIIIRKIRFLKKFLSYIFYQLIMLFFAFDSVAKAIDKIVRSLDNPFEFNKFLSYIASIHQNIEGVTPCSFDVRILKKLI